jgi:6-phosphogluconolactonase
MNHATRFVCALLFSISLVGCQSDGPSDPAAPKESSGPVRVYVGTYTGRDSKGIYVMDLDPKTGSLAEPKLAAETKSPSFLALHPNGKVLYAVGESDNFKGQKSGSVSAFAINGDGTLKLIGEQPSGGAGPCHLDLDRGGTCVFVANYGGGSVAALPIREDGSLGEPASFVQHKGSSVNQQRQEGPHAHCAVVAPSTAFRDPPGGRVLVADLGLDKVLIYEFQSGPAPKLFEVPHERSTPPGGGPRHLALLGERFVYVNNELTSTVSVFSYEPSTGAMAEIQTLSTLPEGYNKPGNSTAEIAVLPSGKFVYVSNRGHDSIAIFKVDQKTGKLTAAGHQSTGGKTPRNFGIEPGGRFLLAANQGSGNVVVFRIDQQTGALTPTGATAAVPTPVCVVFLPR